MKTAALAEMSKETIGNPGKEATLEILKKRVSL
jgi:hypothetical protein